MLGQSYYLARIAGSVVKYYMLKCDNSRELIVNKYIKFSKSNSYNVAHFFCFCVKQSSPWKYHYENNSTRVVW